MNDTSPWPERRRSQRLLFAGGAAFLLPVALAFAGVVDPGGTVVVGSATVASALLIYGLLGWSGTWIGDGADAGTAASGTSGAPDTDPVPPDGDPDSTGDEPDPAGEEPDPVGN